jgi:hypothetical protein
MENNNRYENLQSVTLSAFTAVHGAAKPGKMQTSKGVQHVISCTDGTIAFLGDKLETQLLKAKASGEKFQLDLSRLMIGASKDSQTGRMSYNAYYQAVVEDSEDFTF